MVEQSASIGTPLFCLVMSSSDQEVSTDYD